MQTNQKAMISHFVQMIMYAQGMNESLFVTFCHFSHCLDVVVFIEDGTLY